MSPLRIVLLGKHGQVGYELARSCQGLGEIIAVGREDLNLNNFHDVTGFLVRLNPDLVINAAAYTAVDLAENDASSAMRLNAELPAVLAEHCQKHKSAIVHYSTDYVYDGRQRKPLQETESPAPMSVYGSSKLLGDRAIEESGASSLILRTSWVYASRGRNFLLAILRKWNAGETIRVVDDQIGSPTPARLIAELTAHLIAIVGGAAPGTSISEALRERGGLYHLSTAGECSWFDFAATFLPSTAISSGRLVPIHSSEYPSVARRPSYSVLSSTKVQRTFGVHLPDWKAALSKVLEDLGMELGGGSTSQRVQEAR